MSAADGDKLTAETLCDRISREVLRHGINWNDGDPRCYCGGPLPQSGDQHLAEAVASVFAPELTELATRAEAAEAVIEQTRRRHHRRTDRHGSGCISCGRLWPCPDYSDADAFLSPGGES